MFCALPLGQGIFTAETGVVYANVGLGAARGSSRRSLLHMSPFSDARRCASTHSVRICVAIGMSVGIKIEWSAGSVAQRTDGAFELW